ncbi:hypothetical protein, partial [Acinetobacter baumannii]|uniref:hypothetical protein n=1 Tax=Acinetobacter baumannii TaxID=470 RepID=UPI00197A7E3B
GLGDVYKRQTISITIVTIKQNITKTQSKIPHLLKLKKYYSSYFSLYVLTYKLLGILRIGDALLFS